MTNIKEYLISRVKELFPEIIAHRRKIHAYPELSFKEYRTSEYIRSILEEFKIPYKVLAGTGVTATIGNGGRCAALRADIDALPVNEETGLEYSSGNSDVMHACGHDMHISMLLGAAKLLKEIEPELNGTIKLIFQPGEEQLPGGASLMIKEGALLDPVPDIIFGQHVNPGESAGTISLASGAIMASTDELYFTIKGRGAHAAQPHLGADPILAAANLVVQFQTYISRYKNPLSPAVLTIASFHGGNATNIIPESVDIKGTLRSFNAEWRRETLEGLATYSKDLCRSYRTECDVKIVNGYPALFNSETPTDIARNSGIDLFGSECVKDFEPKMWAEDFAYYAEKIPACFWFLGVRPTNMKEMPALHNPHFAPDENAMINGTVMMAGTALKFIGLKSS